MLSPKTCKRDRVLYKARWHSLLRHCATNQKVEGSTSDYVIGIFHSHNPSGRTVVLGLTQSLTEIRTSKISWGLKEVGAQGSQPYHFMCRLSWNLEASASWNPQDMSRPVMGLLYLLPKSSVTLGRLLIVMFWTVFCGSHRSVREELVLLRDVASCTMTHIYKNFRRNIKLPSSG